MVIRDVHRLTYGLSFIHSGSLGVVCDSMASLDSYQSIDTPFRMDPATLSNYLSTFSIAKQQEANSGIWNSILRQRIMLHEHRLAKTVIDMEHVLCNEIFQRGTFTESPSSWIEELLRDIQARLSVKLPIVFNSRSYIKDHGSPSNRYIEPDWALLQRTKTRKRLSGEELNRVSATYLGRILRFWFDLPSSFVMQGRAQLIDEFLQVFGPGILYFPRVWDLYSALPRFLFKNAPHNYNSRTTDRILPYDPNAMNDFATHLRSASSRTRDVVTLLNESYRSFLRLSQAYSLQLNYEKSNHIGECGLFFLACFFNS